MKLSVIVPCYNAEKWLGACLASILSQDVPDMEILAVDDGSTDGTQDILARAAADDGRLTVFRQENLGVSAARNRALAAAGGEWVCFVDADDELPPGSLAALLAAADETCDLVVGGHCVFGAVPEEEVRPEGRWPALAGEARRHAAALRLIEGDSVLNIMCAKLHRRSLLEREGIRLDEGVRVAEDALFNLEAVLCGRGIRYVPQVVYRYRMHDASVMHTRTGPSFELHRPWLTAMGEMLLRRGEMPRYYAAWMDSVTLRLYKDGGVAGVMRQWREKALPLVRMPQLDGARLAGRSAAMHALVRTGLYPWVYPAIWAAQTARRHLAGT